MKVGDRVKLTWDEVYPLRGATIQKCAGHFAHVSKERGSDGCVSVRCDCGARWLWPACLCTPIDEDPGQKPDERSCKMKARYVSYYLVRREVVEEGKVVEKAVALQPEKDKPFPRLWTELEEEALRQRILFVENPLVAEHGGPEAVEICYPFQGSGRQ